MLQEDETLRGEQRGEVTRRDMRLREEGQR